LQTDQPSRRQNVIYESNRPTDRARGLETERGFAS